jgi:hypothetical protein
MLEGCDSVVWYIEPTFHNLLPSSLGWRWRPKVHLKCWYNKAQHHIPVDQDLQLKYTTSILHSIIFYKSYVVIVKAHFHKDVGSNNEMRLFKSVLFMAQIYMLEIFHTIIQYTHTNLHINMSKVWQKMYIPFETVCNTYLLNVYRASCTLHKILPPFQQLRPKELALVSSPAMLPLHTFSF